MLGVGGGAGVRMPTNVPPFSLLPHIPHRFLSEASDVVGRGPLRHWASVGATAGGEGGGGDTW